MSKPKKSREFIHVIQIWVILKVGIKTVVNDEVYEKNNISLHNVQ